MTLHCANRWSVLQMRALQQVPMAISASQSAETRINQGQMEPVCEQVEVLILSQEARLHQTRILVEIHSAISWGATASDVPTTTESTWDIFYQSGAVDVDPQSVPQSTGSAGLITNPHELNKRSCSSVVLWHCRSGHCN